jgi:DNA repair protein RadC
MSINDWPQDERPRERLIKHGARALSDAELLAIFLRVGVTGKSAVDLSRELLARFGTLAALFGASQEDLCTINGIGPAKYVQLQAVIEMARRSFSEQMSKKSALDSPKDVRDYLRLTLANLPHEVFVVVFLNTKNEVIVVEELFRGSLTQTSVYPREVVKRALACNAASAILAHNHPDGGTEPSISDKTLTKSLVEALKTVDVQVLDHFIVSPSSSTSFAEQGMMRP